MKFLTITNSFFKSIRNRAFDPERDWLALLTLSAIVLASIVIWNVWTFETVVNGGVIGISATSTPPVFNRSSLDKIHLIFTNRAEEKIKFQTGVYRFSDPSQ